MQTNDRVSMLSRVRVRLSHERQLVELPGRDTNERGALFKDYLASINSAVTPDLEKNDGDLGYATRNAPSMTDGGLMSACGRVVGSLLNQGALLHHNRHIPTLVNAYV